MLANLFNGARSDAAARELDIPLREIERLATESKAALDARSFLYHENEVRVIAEIKRASPSRGDIAPISDPANLAVTYEKAGAGAISVLTEGRSFLGSLEDLKAVRDSVGIPVLRKDFISTEYQVLEARAYGADLVLLIVAGLESRRLVELKDLVEQLGMTALVETHTESEIMFANDIGSQIIGINARDLETFDTDRSLFGKLSSLVNPRALRVAESAIRNVEDVVEYASFGADCVLVGEAFVTGDSAAMIDSFSQVQKA